MDSLSLPSRNFLSTPLPRHHALSFKLGGWVRGVTPQYKCAQRHTHICVLDTTSCADPALDLNTLLWKAQISLSLSLSLSVPDCGWWGSSQEYTAFCIQPTRTTWLLWHWGSCKFAWLHTSITLDTARWVRGIWRWGRPFSGSIMWPVLNIKNTSGSGHCPT